MPCFLVRSPTPNHTFGTTTLRPSRQTISRPRMTGVGEVCDATRFDPATSRHHLGTRSSVLDPSVSLVYDKYAGSTRIIKEPVSGKEPCQNENPQPCNISLLET